MSLLGIRDRLRAALERDDAAEEAGMHPDGRDTCFRCRGWASDGHAHDPVSGRWMSGEDWQRTWAGFMRDAER